MKSVCPRFSIGFYIADTKREIFASCMLPPLPLVPMENVLAPTAASHFSGQLPSIPLVFHQPACRGRGAGRRVSCGRATSVGDSAGFCLVDPALHWALRQDLQNELGPLVFFWEWQVGWLVCWLIFFATYWLSQLNFSS